MTANITLVLEQTLGNAVHGKNLARVAHGDRRVNAHIVEVVPGDPATGRQRLPLVGNWTVDASRQARRAVIPRVRGGLVDALLVNTQCPAQLLPDVMRRVPTVVSTDATPLGFDTVGESYGHRPAPTLVERVKARITGDAFRAAAAVRTWSEWAADSVVRDYGVPRERVHVIYPGVQTCRFTQRQRHRPHEGLRLLFVGGEFRRKGGEDLLDAYARLGPGFELDIVTAAPPPRVPPGVRVHVGLTHQSPELFHLYAEADLFVLPTLADTLGLVFAEALAAGVPVVACDVGGVREIVQPGETGLLVSPHRPAELAEAIRRLAEAPELRQRLSATGRELVLRDHDADRNCRAVVDLLLSVIEESTARASHAKGGRRAA